MPRPVPQVSFTDEQWAAFRTQRHAVAVSDAVFRIEGAGAIECLQGLLTNDVAKPAAGTAIWGAFLTPKGMIITDAWVLRDGAAAWVLVPASQHQSMLEHFRKTIPPRLAAVTDMSDAVAVRWLCGGMPGAVRESGAYTPHGPAPFTAVLLTRDASTTDANLTSQGWESAPPSYGDVYRLLIGWPTLGREIDERTLPQEVRFDDLGGVRYDKGCYTGQETVARLHFRGHANRALRGVCWAPGDRPTDTEVRDGDKAVGDLRTVMQFGDRTVALAMIRREIGLGDTIRTGDSEGLVVEPPFDLGEPAVA